MNDNFPSEITEALTKLEYSIHLQTQGIYAMQQQLSIIYHTLTQLVGEE